MSVSERSAVDLHCHTREPTRKISEYADNAQACLKLAAMISDPEHKTTLLHMADTWTMLAHGRKKRPSKGPLSNDDDATDEE